MFSNPFPESADQAPGSAVRPWTVSTLTQYIKECLESDPGLQDVWLEGEISNFSPSTAGHLYFTLKDSGASISCVMWRGAASQLAWQPKQGDAAVTHGYISVYPVRGAYQLYVNLLRPAGIGDLHAQFEQLKEKLQAEGLFDTERKRKPPPFPEVIGVVTSPQAAALRDVLQVLRRRYPLVQVLLSPTLVQGDMAPPRIVAALQALDARENVDLILLVRGGGSMEELWAFNDERVARTIAACRHPVISGVGHETDFTIADFVADLRAPTPSAAAELAVPDMGDLRQSLEGWTRKLLGSMTQQLTQARRALSHEHSTLQRLSPQARVTTHRQQVDDLIRQGIRAVAHGLALRGSALDGLQARLAALSPLATLERGYAIVRLEDTGEVVRHVQQVQAGDTLTVRVQDGEFGAITRNGP